MITESTELTEVMGNVNQRLHAGEIKRLFAEDLGVTELTLRKRLKTGAVPNSLGRFKTTFTNEEEKELDHYCRDLDARFCGLTIRTLTELAFEYADRNGTDHRFKKENKNAGKDCVISFCGRQNLSITLPEKCSLGRTIGFNGFQVTRFFK